MSQEDDLLIPSEFGRKAPVDMEANVKAGGIRLDLFLPIFFPDYSRSELQKAIEAGSITVNGRTVRCSYKVRSKDKLHVEMPEPAHEAPKAENIPLDIVYQDEFLAIINKPSDMVVHPAKGNWSGTLANALSWHFKDLSSENGSFRPGIVHRLDKDTSGVILIAFDNRTHRDMSMMFEQRRIFKEYAALTYGVVDRDSDYIEGRIKHHPHDRVKMTVTSDPDDAEAKDACSYYETVERFRGFSFVRIQPRTGRTHQIRVHLGSIGCNVIADKVYSGRDSLKLSEVTGVIPPEGEEDEVLLKRQALHAYRLRFCHPRLDRWMEFEAPIPPDFEKALVAMRTHRRLT